MVEQVAAPKNTGHLDSINCLRGIASLLVCICHVGIALHTNHATYTFFNYVDPFGYFGVCMFFVISGFVIPLSLDKGRYNIGNYFRFLYKRVLRLHIPYLCALAFTLIIMVFSYNVRHVPFPDSKMDMIKMLFYLKSPSDNGVFWSLAVEAQYYIFIGLFFLLMYKYPKLTVGLGIPALVVIAQYTPIGQHLTFFLYILCFLVGMVGYLIFEKRGAMMLNYAMVIAVLVCTFIYYGAYPLVATTIAIAFILYFKGPIPKVFHFLGSISYSLYLLHSPIGIKLMNLLKGRFNASYDIILFAFAIAVILLVSWAFSRLIEGPSERLSRKIKYR